MKNLKAIKEEIAKINASLNVIAQLIEGGASVREMYSANFSFTEMNGGNTPTTEQRQNLHELAEQLEAIRATVKRPIKITRALHSEAQNAAVGGATRSQHLFGRAADIQISGYTPSEVKQVIERLIEEGKIKEGGLSAYANHVHYDTRGTKTRW